MKNLNISKIKERKYSSSVTVSKPKKGSITDITAVNYDLKEGSLYSASIKIVHTNDFSFEQEVNI